jgi:hypothetical protein
VRKKSQPKMREIERLVLELASRKQNPVDPNPREFKRAAFARLAVAEYLLVPPKSSEMPIAPKFYLEAIYLGGYAVECAMKAMILERTVKSKRRERFKAISGGAIYHQFDILERVLRIQNVQIPEVVLQSIRIITPQWTTDLRYAGAIVPKAEAVDFLKHARQIVEWVERSL